MLTLNFGSEKLKKDVRLKRIFRLVKKVNIVLFLFFIFISGIFFSSKIILEKNYKDTKDQLDIYSKRISREEERIKIINQKTNRIININTSIVNWSEFLKLLSMLMPDGVKLTKLNLNNADGQFQFSGYSDTRENLLAFKSNLESSPIFLSPLKFPLKNILEKENIYFQIDGFLNIQELKKEYETNGE